MPHPSVPARRWSAPRPVPTHPVAVQQAPVQQAPTHPVPTQHIPADVAARPAPGPEIVRPPSSPDGFPSVADTEFLTLAIEVALRSVAAGGGPFGAVLAHDGLVLGLGTNEVSRNFDPTAHAEMVALRAACRRLGRTELADCVLYTNCEPCPLCYSALRWARVPRLVHAASRASALASGYVDELAFETLERTGTAPILVQQAWLEASVEPFAAWRDASRPA